MLYATVLVLLALTFALNIAAVVVRARMRRRAAGGARMTTGKTAEPTPPKLTVKDLTVSLRRQEGGRPGGRWTSSAST